MSSHHPEHPSSASRVDERALLAARAHEFAFARVVSIVGHPFAFITLLLLVPFLRKADTGALRIAALVAVVGLVPLGLFMWQRYRSGRWLTVDASDPADRPVAYLAGFAVLLPFALYFYFVEHSMLLFRGSLVIGAMMAVAVALNPWLKGSGHMAFAGFSAVVLTRIGLGYWLPVALFLPLLAWSRMKLWRHTLPEVLGGLALGLVAGASMLRL